MDPSKAHEAIDALIEGMTDAERMELFEHVRATYSEQLGSTAVNGAVKVEAAQNEDLTHEQQEKAAKLSTAMAEKFGVLESDFSVLRTTDEDGKDVFTVAYTAVNGIDLGDPQKDKDYDEKRSWNGIFDKKANKNFTVTVDGEKVDTRTGMTGAVYSAFIADAKARGVNPLPDSQQLSDENDEVWTDTWLTGEYADRVRLAPFAYVDEGGRVNHYGAHTNRGIRLRRFRPAVVIE